LSENVFAVESSKHTPFVGRGTRPRDDGALDHVEEEESERVEVELPTARTSERYGPVANPVVPVVERVPVVRAGTPPPESSATPAAAQPVPVQPVGSFPVRTPPGVEKPALQRLKDLLRTTNRRRNSPLA
jgi:hypothetical protein